MEQFKEYLNTLSSQEKDKALRELYDQMSLEQKTTIFNEMQTRIDYIIYSVGYEYRLMNEDSLETIHEIIDEEEDVNDNDFRILFMFYQNKEYFNCDRIEDKYVEHPEAKIIYEQVKNKLNHIYDGIVVKNCLGLYWYVHRFIEAVIECCHCACLSIEACDIRYYKITVNNEIKTVLHLTYDTESG